MPAVHAMIAIDSGGGAPVQGTIGYLTEKEGE